VTVPNQPPPSPIASPSGKSRATCHAEPAKYLPVVDRGRCEGKSDCAEVCPLDVFDVRTIRDEDFAALSFLQKLKSRAHGKKTAYATRAASCKACGLCVVACPEDAITLVLATRE
jgi:NAD-dependent dihydropyrimidine dehydrogenase PreA subunit